jgi:nucleoside 2-deoxyribosyltransferase
MIVVGGTYDEFCFEPRWEQKYGSGFRACWVLNKLNPTNVITFHTFADTNSKSYLEQFKQDINFNPVVIAIDKTVQFQYDFPLATPTIHPRPDLLTPAENKINVSGENILYYGMIEGIAVVNGNKVIYDPQSPSNPKPFSKTGSTAKELAVVINLTEARRMVGDRNANIEKIRKFFFENEKVTILVLKMGPKGAMVFYQNETEVVPVYETTYVWPIGSGDVFAAVFAHYWVTGSTPLEAAKMASWNTACYCNSQTFNFPAFESLEDIKPLHMKDFPKGQVYLAGPFFTFSERWLVEQIYRCLSEMNIKVFSPWHHVGYGSAKDVVHLDIKGINESKLIFAIIDGLDSGTLFEVGYSIAKEIPVICYVENESSDSTKMMEGTNCILEKDLTTAIYKSLWMLSKNEK